MMLPARLVSPLTAWQPATHKIVGLAKGRFSLMRMLCSNSAPPKYFIQRNAATFFSHPCRP
ncbi:hypothetical protein B0H12DRAFT_1124176 [Mycena haematopus]|nr:hypothetical protein B0H12DRAFT_1124176 [Mycena haematopus]